MLKILIVDDHALFRTGLKRILTDEFENAAVSEVADTKQLLKEIQNGAWDIVLLDISLPNRSGLDVLKEIKTLCPDLPVLIVSMHAEEQFAKRAFRAGASGYITKERATEELIVAIKKVLIKGRYVSESLAEAFADEIASERPEFPHEALTNREFEIMRWIASGKTVSEIAKALSISVKTVSTHRARILEKMHMSSNNEIMHYMFQHGLITR